MQLGDSWEICQSKPLLQWAATLLSFIAIMVLNAYSFKIFYFYVSRRY
jgi:hypothetical protein